MAFYEPSNFIGKIIKSFEITILGITELPKYRKIVQMA